MKSDEFTLSPSVSPMYKGNPDGNVSCLSNLLVTHKSPPGINSRHHTSTR